MRNKMCAALAIVLLLGTAACGGGSGSRPSTDDISKALQKGTSSGDLGGIPKLDKKAADCIAKSFADSKLSDKALNALVSGDSKFKPSASDTKALTGIIPAMAKCAPALAGQ
ncbi:MAG: hypothetical protein JWR35_1317 [Marmoricola sp.]|jgi:hypothetical protein|nr:hypothetical protein [Marmoricola sp.]